MSARLWHGAHVVAWKEEQQRLKSERKKERKREYARARYCADRDTAKAKSAAYALENREAINQATKVRRAKDPTYRRSEKLRQRYGITVEEWDALFTLQGKCCAICKTTEPTKSGWHTDHRHGDGLVRGILCHKCNIMLGNAGDNAERLRAAIVYLER